MSELLALVRGLLGADIVVAARWLDDETAIVQEADPPLGSPEAPVLTIARAALAEQGAVFETARVRRYVSSALGHALPRRAAAVWAVAAAPRPEPDGAVLAIWYDAPASPPAAQVEVVREALARYFAPDQDSAAVTRLAARFAAVMAVIPQATVFVEDTVGTGLVNRAAAALLDVPEGQVPSAQLSAAMAALRRAATNQAEIDARARTLLADTRFRVDDWLWTYGDPVTRDLRVGTYPVGDSTLAGRLWVFDDVTSERAAERLLAQRFEAVEELNEELAMLNEELGSARDDADRANEAKSTFLNQMSHELRTPLNAIIGFTNVLLRDKAARPTKDVLYLTRIRDNGTHLLSLLNGILDLAKIEAGKLEIVRAPTDLASLVVETVAQLEGQPRKPGVQLMAEVSSSIAVVETDAPKLKQVLINLVGNALKFTERGAVTVALVAGDAGQPVAIEVRDTGIGIPPERLAAVFEAFEQAEKDTSNRFGGTGLGLAISKRLTEALGYRLELASTVGVGTTFTVRL